MSMYRSFRGRKSVQMYTLFGLTLSISIALVIFLVHTHGLATLRAYRLVRTYESTTEDSPSHSHPRTILLWTKIWGNSRWYMDEDTMDPTYLRDRFHCPEYNCIVTNNRDLLPSVTMFDAVMFHTAEAIYVPSQRSAAQLYVFAQMESPAATYHNLADEQYFYNLSMTYRLDSDILWPYAYIVEIETGHFVAPSVTPYWRLPPTEWNDTAVWKAWPGKNKSVVWFVSHCNALSGRDRLVKALQKHIDVDVYGKCGTLTCERYSSNCDELIDRDYKFYLAFENALCIDYVTEKVYDQMKRQIIPVVFGGANYTRFLPPQSYIDAELFETVTELAEYLKYLAANPTEYMRYFWWREHYHVINYNSFCDLCELLNSPQTRYKQQIYTNMEKWWYDGTCRTKSKIKY